MSLRTAYPTFFALPQLLIRLITFRWWTWRLTRRLLFTSATFATIIALFYGIENWRGRRAYAAVVREAAAAGISLDIRDYAQPPVPDAQNLAKLSLLDAPKEGEIRSQFWTQLGNRLRLQPAKERGSGASPSDLPQTGMPAFSINQKADFSALRAEVQRDADEYNHENLDAFLARLAPLFLELREASARRTYLSYDYDWTKTYNITLPDINIIRGLSHISVVQALAHLKVNQTNAAAEALSLPLRLSRAIQREPFPISQLSAIAISGMAINHIWQGQLTHVWTDAELDLFSALLADDQILASFRRSIASSAAASGALTLQIPDILLNHPELWGGKTPYRGAALLAETAPIGWLQQNAAASVRYYLHEGLPSIDPASGRVYPFKVRPSGRNLTNSFLPYVIFAEITSFNFAPLIQAAGNGKTTHDLARLAIALEKHLLAHGTYPDSLAPVLATTSALAALHDPFDGQPYRYRREADGGFTLWGVGQNLQDDGGAFPDLSDNRANYETGDVVWRVPGR